MSGEGDGASGESTLGFIGLGTMGLPMACSLLRGGLAVKAFDLRAEPLEEVLRCGGQEALSVGEIAETCSIVLVALVDDRQVEQLLVGDGTDGLLHVATPGSLVVLHSTLRPSTCRRLAELGRQRNVDVVDAPLSGGPGAAAAGSLTFMVGGDLAAVERCRPALAAMGSRIFHMGPIGTGEIAKLTNNVAFAITMQSVVEALRFATSAGLDEATMREILTGCTADSWAMRMWTEIGETAVGYPGGSAGLAKLTYKDLQIALEIAHEQGAALPVTALTSQLVEEPYLR